MNEMCFSQLSTTGTDSSLIMYPEKIRNSTTTAGATCGAISTERSEAESTWK